MDKLRRMEIFVAVAESGHFTHAAKVLNLSKSAVSQGINDLESYLGIQLIKRNNRNFQITDVGQEYLVQCHRVLGDINEFEEKIQNVDQSISGKIKITASVTFGAKKLAPILADFMNKYPDVSIELDLSDRIFDLMHEGIDIGVRISDLEDSSLIAKKLSTISMCLCASPDLIERSGSIDELSDLSTVSCLKYSGVSNWGFSKEGKKIVFTPKCQLESTSGEALAEFVTAGVGVAYLPDFIVEDIIASGKAIEILTQYERRQYGVFAMFASNRHRPLRVRRLIDFLSDNLIT